MSLTGEDFVGRISTITKGSLKSTRLLELGRKVLSKYLVGLSIRWSDHYGSESESVSNNKKTQCTRVAIGFWFARYMVRIGVDSSN